MYPKGREMKNLFKKKIVIIPLLIAGFVGFVYFSIDWEEDNAPIDIESNFPLPDYLFNSDIALQQNQNQPLPTPPNNNDDDYKQTQEDLEQITKEIDEELKKVKETPKTEQTPTKQFVFLTPSQTNTKPQSKPKKSNKPLTMQEKQRLGILSSRIVGFEESEENEIKPKPQTEYGVDGFSNFNKKDIGSNEHRLLRTITADKLIPAFLVTPISSQIAGKVVAQVETNIYGAMGRAVLIPKGSKVIGYYNNNNKIGEYRLNIAWTRIITPQGINIILSDARGADVKGYSGLVGEVISRDFEKYGMPLLISTLSNGLLISLSTALSKEASETNNFYGQYALTELSKTAKNDVSAVVEQVIRDKAKINPIIIIREGSRVFISPNTDIFIPIPRKNEVLAEFFKEKKPIQKEKENE